MNREIQARADRPRNQSSRRRGQRNGANRQTPEIGKVGRAEPVSALYEQGLVHHVGHLAELEDEMTNWEPSPMNREIQARAVRLAASGSLTALDALCKTLFPEILGHA